MVTPLKQSLPSLTHYSVVPSVEPNRLFPCSRCIQTSSSQVETASGRDSHSPKPSHHWSTEILILPPRFSVDKPEHQLLIVRFGLFLTSVPTSGQLLRRALVLICVHPQAPRQLSHNVALVASRLHASLQPLLWVKLSRLLAIIDQHASTVWHRPKPPGLITGRRILIYILHDLLQPSRLLPLLQLSPFYQHSDAGPDSQISLIFLSAFWLAHQSSHSCPPTPRIRARHGRPVPCQDARSVGRP